MHLMRHLAIALAIVGGLALLATPALAGGWSLDDYLKQKPKSDWDGFGPGTMIHTRMTQETTIPQVPAPQKQVTETKKTLVKVTEDSYVIKVERLVGNDWIASEEIEKKDDGSQAKVEDIGTGTVTVEGTAYPCTKKKVTWTEEGKDPKEFVLWVNDDNGILRMEMGTSKPVLTVTKLAASWPIGDVTVTGRELEMSMDMPQGKVTGTMRMSMDVPNNMVRQETSGSQRDVKFNTVNELIAFVKK